MGDLREQMLKAGLVSKKQARRSAHGKRVDNKIADPKEKKRTARAAQDSVDREAEAKKSRDRQLAAGRNAAEQRKVREMGERQRLQSALANALRDGALANWSGAKTYYFQDGKVVESLQLTGEAAARMERGQAAIVRHEGEKSGYAVITSGAAAKLRELAADAIVCWHRQ